MLKLLEDALPEVRESFEGQEVVSVSAAASGLVDPRLGRLEIHEEADHVVFVINRGFWEIRLPKSSTAYLESSQLQVRNGDEVLLLFLKESVQSILNGFAAYPK